MSKRIKEQFENGREYYGLEGRTVREPELTTRLHFIGNVTADVRKDVEFANMPQGVLETAQLSETR